MVTERPAVSMGVILESLASPVRLEMLKLLSRRDMAYSELMSSLGMDRDRDAGKFSYHLKRLLESGLVEVERETGKYRLSRAGSTVLDSLARLEKTLGLREMMIVRTTRHVVEPFDRSKIVKSLVREANMTHRLASEVASVAEEKLKELRIEYLTSSLIREVVNSILLDMGLEKYRHRLTRVGMPVYDVSKSLRKISRTGDPREFAQRASESIMREYCLQAMLPRGVAEMHLAGELDLYSLEIWLTGVLARSYPAPGDEDTVSEMSVEIAGQMLNIRHEINFRAGDAETIMGAVEVVKRLLRGGVPGGRYFSITARLEDLLEKHRAIAEEVRRLDGAENRIKLAVVIEDLGQRETQGLGELSRRLGLEYAVTNSDYSLYSGLTVRAGGDPSDVHAILALNMAFPTLQEGGGIAETLESVRKLASAGLSALTRRTKIFREIYAGKYRGDIVYYATLCGLFEAVRRIQGSGTLSTRDSSEFMRELLKTFRDQVKRDQDKTGIVLLTSRTARSSARRMARSMRSRAGAEGSTDHAGFFLMADPNEKYKSIEERAATEAEIASYVDGGYVTMLRDHRRRRFGEEVRTIFQRLAEAGNTFTIIFGD